MDKDEFEFAGYALLKGYKQGQDPSLQNAPGCLCAFNAWVLLCGRLSLIESMAYAKKVQHFLLVYVFLSKNTMLS